MARSLKLTVTTARRDVRTLIEGEFTVEQLTEHFSNVEVGDKDGEAVIPAVFRPCPPTCRNHGKPKALDCGGNALHRLSANVEAMTALAADIDGATEAVLASVLEGLRARGLRFWHWQTHSHAPPNDCRARIIIPFAAPLPLVNPRQWTHVAWPALMEAVGLPVVTDWACRDPCRIFYLPRKPTADATREAGYVDGHDLDWRALLGDSLERVAAAPAASAPPIPQDPSKPVDLGDLREKLKRISKPGTKALVRRVLSGKAPTSPPDQRKPGEPSRYEAWRQVTGAIAANVEGWEATDAVLSIVRDAYADEVETSPDDHTEWETLEHLYETAVAGMPALRAQKEAERKASEEVFRRALGRTVSTGASAPKGPDPGNPTEPSGLEPSAGGAPVEGSVPEGVEGEGWTRGLILDPPTGKNAAPTVKNCAANVAVLLQAHPDWRDALRYNEVTKYIELWREGAPRPLEDEDVVDVGTWLAQTFDIHQSDGVIWARMMRAAKRNAYDPLRDFLLDTRHDGVRRLETLLETYFEVPASEFARKAGRRWLISAAARGLDPGCQADSVLILEGLQGTGKTTAARIIGGPFVLSESIDFASKDSLQAVSQAWIVELGELEAFRKSEATSQKHFLSKKTDDFRPPYGRVTKRHPRRCVFMGTVNTDDYLHDETGNRRVWPVAAGEIKVEALERDRDQLIAEAVALYQAAATCPACAARADGEKRCVEHRWWFGRAEQVLVSAETDMRMAPDAIADAVEAWILGKPVDKRPTTVLTHEIITDVLKESPAKGLEMRIAKALRRLKFERFRNDRRKGYRVPEELQRAPRREGPLTGRLVHKEPEARA